MEYAISQSHTAQTQFGHLWCEHLPDGCPLFFARPQLSRMSHFELFCGTEEGLVGGSDSRTKLSADALSKPRGAQAADQSSGVLLMLGGVQGLVLGFLKRCPI